ncbi:active regulator of sirt1 [Holotrichia oblita]|uniref:Active regulator of sirt1 n=1 Tax=Holotrichia oblita TaxID=644536 RepID=A0ACB9TZG9_HOLOL|nr:active regulator of sirt1 [Holotrichia oblita]
MSAALVRKSLALVDPSFNAKARKKNGGVDFLPNDKKFAKNIQKKRNKRKTTDLPSKTKKLTVKDLQHTLKSKNEILQRNLKKLELIKKICTIDLSTEVTSQLFERAVTRRPVNLKSKKPQKKEEKTVFTEEDFKRFESEYLES